MPETNNKTNIQPEWIKESDDQYKTAKRPIPESIQERVYVFDKDYRCLPWDRQDLHDQSSLSFKHQPLALTVDQTENAHTEQPTPQPPNGDTNGSNRKPFFPDDFPISPKSIKEYITEKDGNVCIPLHPTTPLKKRGSKLFLPLECGEITMDGLVDSGPFINAMPWSDYNAIKMNSESCVIKEDPEQPFKIECANAQLEQPIATADIQFNIGTYNFTDTLVILSKTTFP